MERPGKYATLISVTGIKQIWSALESDRETMAETLKLMAVLGHPDDESLGSGGVLAKYSAEGRETFLGSAPRGGGGWVGDQREKAGLGALGQSRGAEL